ncbi:MAG: cation transporter [Alphaproteobacteria bacterium]|nr:cation transporter [Alphaproteobacteria bacterium]
MVHHHHLHSINRENEKKTLWVIVLTFITMGAEITYGYLTNSMALLADGYHMGTHALALGLTYAAYVLMRCCAGSVRFPNGTDKIGTLAAYTSSLFLGLTGVWIIFEAILRFISPRQIDFNEAIVVAIIGLAVNGICIAVMETGHHEHNKAGHHDEDYNFKAAYYHILADALTSVLAIVALIVGKQADIVCLDAIVGAVGGVLIVKWAGGLLYHTTVVLVDMRQQEKS